MAMLPREYGRGERLRADDWNRSVRSLGRHQEAIERMRPAGRALSTGYVPGVHISVHNDTGEALSPRDIAGIKEHTFPNNPDDITISVEIPVAGTHEGKFVIVQESIPTDGIGDAIIVGCSLCTVSLVDENHEYAEIMDDETGKLESRKFGTAKILWHDGLSGSSEVDVTALVRFPEVNDYPGTTVFISNDTGADIDAVSVMGIKGHGDTGSPENIIITVEDPEAGKHEGKFVIIPELIANGTIGKGIISGLAICTVNMIDENHEYAEIIDADNTKLESRPAGSARILWREDPSGSGTEDVLALVEFPLDGPPPVWEATADESSGEITAKRIDSTGALVGAELTFTVLPEAGS